MEAGEIDCIHIEQLEIFAHVGVTDNERANPQRLTVSLTFWPDDDLANAHDDITRTVDYSAVAAAVRAFAIRRPHNLIETMANDLSSELLKKFAIKSVQIELRKFVLPDAQYVSVVLTRTAAA